jgi:hypothetical protein
MVLSWKSLAPEMLVVIERSMSPHLDKWAQIATTTEDAYLDTRIKKHRSYCYRLRYAASEVWASQACGTVERQ